MHPIFFAAAAVVGLPILLHLLLRQQPKKLLFPALRFLKQRQKSSRRKVQLRHIMLLALRVLLLLLFALALFQPTLSLGGQYLDTDRPIAAVFVIDTSPSMGYRDGTPRLDTARLRALELLDKLPANSQVAVLTTHDPTGEFQPTLFETRQRIEAIKETSGSGESLAPALQAAYRLFKNRPDANTEEIPKLVAVFSDRTYASWDATRTAGLQERRDEVPKPAPVHLYFDVGTDTPVNLAVTDVRMESDRLPGAADAVVTALVRCDGPDAEVILTAELDGAGRKEEPVKLSGGGVQAVRFTFPAPPPGFHVVTVKLDRDDLLPADNERTFTFEVEPRRPILCVSDSAADARLWRQSHNDGLREFECAVATPDKLPPLAPFEMVAVIAVADPGPIAKQLTDYVQAGGRLFLAPDGRTSETDPDLAKRYEALGELMPAKLGPVKVLSTPDDRTPGAAWKLDEPADLRHRLFDPVRGWSSKTDVFSTPRRAWKARTVTDVPGNTEVVAKYADAVKDADRTSALLERTAGKGTVLLATTRLDTRADDAKDGWNDYWQLGHSWPVVFPWLVAKYLTESDRPQAAAADTPARRYNFATGDTVPVSVRGFTAPGERAVRLEGPGVAAEKSRFTLPADAGLLLLRNKTSPPPVATAGDSPPAEWTLDDDPLFSPGAFAVRPDGAVGPWEFRFSVAVPPGESDPARVPEASLEQLLGPKPVIPVKQDFELDASLREKITPPFELFPMLIVLVLLFFAFEGVMANRFYKLK